MSQNRKKRFFLILLLIYTITLIGVIASERLQQQSVNIGEDVFQQINSELPQITLQMHADQSESTLSLRQKSSVSPTDGQGHEQQGKLCAEIQMKDSLFQIGWDQIYLKTKRSCSDETQMYSAGFLEGFVSYQKIWLSYVNNGGLQTGNAELSQLLTFFNDLAGRFAQKLKKIRQIHHHNQQQHIQSKASQIQSQRGSSFSQKSDNSNREEQVEEVEVDHHQNLKSQSIRKYHNTMIAIDAQLRGMLDGYNSAQQDPESKLNISQLYYLNTGGQIKDLGLFLQIHAKLLNAGDKGIKFHQKHLKKNNFKRNQREGTHDNSNQFHVEQSLIQTNNQQDQLPMKQKKQLYIDHLTKGRCSVFFKVIQDAKGNVKDFLAAHSTWENYSGMMRIYKFYEFQILNDSADSEKALEVQLSSYPGAITSGDDFFLVRDRLFITETTLEIKDAQKQKLFTEFKPEDIEISDFVRLLSATYSAANALEWTQLMHLEKTQLYNSEWFVVDLKKLTANKPLQDNTIFMVDQVMNRQVQKDLSQHLREKQYVGSYNNPYFPEIRDYTGYTVSEKENDYDSFEGDPRGIIFSRLQKRVNSVKDLQWLMQHNAYSEANKSNPDSDDPTFGSAGFAIGARFDSEGRYFGEVDSKVFDLQMAKDYRVLAINGPSKQEQKVFTWPQDTKEPNFGLPKTWNFDWVEMSLNNFAANKPN